MNQYESYSKNIVAVCCYRYSRGVELFLYNYIDQS